MNMFNTDSFSPNGAVFRPARTRDELEALLRLRYEVYSQSALKAFLNHNQRGIDVDEYDVGAIHMGLFASDATDALPLGYIRIVTGDRGAQAGLVEQIAVEYPDLRDSITKPTDQPFPCMTYFPELTGLLVRTCRRVSRGAALVEPGRFAVASGLQGRRLGIRMIQAVAAYCIARRSPVAIVVCCDSHVRMYSAMGFRPVEDIGRRIYDGFPCNYMVGDVRNLPQSTMPAILTMAGSWKRYGGVRFDFESTRDRRPRVAA